MGVLEQLIERQQKIESLEAEIGRFRTELRMGRKTAQRALGIPTLPSFGRWVGGPRLTLLCFLLALPLAFVLGPLAIQLFFIAAVIAAGLFMVSLFSRPPGHI